MTVAQGGVDASAYLGRSGVGQPNYGQMVVDLDPGIIVFLIGANDAANPLDPVTRFDLYKSNISDAFDLFAASTAQRVVVLSILPVNEPVMMAAFGNNSGQGMNNRVDTNYNPWLQSEVAARPNFEYLDVNAAMKANPNWATELLGPDGLHPSDPAGRQLLANQVLAVIPEPSSFLAVAVCCLAGCGVSVSNKKKRRGLIGAAARLFQRHNDR
jgi:lysophospholipase L1-like esterase